MLNIQCAYALAYFVGLRGRGSDIVYAGRPLFPALQLCRKPDA